ncbi:phosphoribosylglycinamide formyltransferase [Thermohalobacter berrensis]|uniref:Phosphoribosylglycinamide formyltransferase n=1 Tax=Thermohalobacter berrensis TaxID=99594 RepID=A0A419SV00_9FIRM|nr:phosphoribosylglycinamide formyltransferase [Thermohalobacter berrensis]RKD29037.1 phosphoribosylglycinamide formyltransferase [Thermohalobacter berrensis]
MSLVKIGVLISGSGTNLQSIIDNIKLGKINGKISIVISNKKEAYGLTRAKKNGIDSLFLDRKQFDSHLDYDKAIIEEFKKRGVELVVLAGYLKILTKEFVKEFRNKIINIHPSLIPSFCGKGYYGSHVHKAALEYGVKISGATVHFVDEGTDTGPIILQESVRLDESETVDSLREKVLKIEHKLLPEAIGLYCEGKLKVEGRKVRIIN